MDPDGLPLSEVQAKVDEWRKAGIIFPNYRFEDFAAYGLERVIVPDS